MPKPHRRRDPRVDDYLTVCTQEEVAHALGISRVRVGQLEKSALEKLRIAFEKEGYEEREPSRPFPNRLSMSFARTERAKWAWNLLTAECDEAPRKVTNGQNRIRS